MVYEGRSSRRSGRGRNVKKSGGIGRACLWLLVIAVAACLVFPGKARDLRDRAAGALGIDIEGAARVFRQERESGAGLLGAAGTSVMYAFGAEDNGRVPASDTDPEGGGADTPAMGDTGDNELADLPLPKYVSAETPELSIELTRPVEGRVTSSFGYKRDATGEGAVFHYGADLSSPEGSPVHAMADGEVMAVGDSTTYGRYVIISHDGGVETIYAHLGKTGTAGGEKVRAGQEIGVMGTDEYLHLELIVDGMYVDPEGYLK